MLEGVIVLRRVDRRRFWYRQEPFKGMSMDRKQGAPWTVPIATLLLVALIWWGGYLTSPPPATRQINYSEFLAEIEAGKISQVEIATTNLVGTLKSSTEDGVHRISTARLPNMEDARLLEVLAAHKVAVVAKPAADGLWNLIAVWFFPLLLLLLIFRGARARQGAAGQLGFSKSHAKVYDQYTQSNVTFKDVAGVDEAEAELVEVVDFLKHPEKYTKLGGRIPKGVLLVGPPGTGKTLLAKAVSGEAGVPFLYISGSEFMEMFVGVGAARVRDLFEQAKQRAPCIIFIDELDAIGKSRAAGRGMFLSHDERDQTLNQLLAEMDGFDSSSGVIIMAATNTPEVLDAALLRAGRFDRQVLVDRPDVEGREAILKIHAAKIKLDSNVDLKTIAARTPGMVGADLANVVNEGALLAARRLSESVAMKDIEEAIDRVLLGLEKKHRVMSKEEKERVAYHEAGHALTALSVPHADPVHRVSIIPRAIGALGHTLQLPTEERFLMTRAELEDQITIMMGGRAAEEITYHGEISTGASNDLERASELSRQMITRFGMSGNLGNLTYGRPLSGKFLPGWGTEDRNYSEDTAKAIDEEVRRISDECHDRAMGILTSRRDLLERIAQELIERETIDHARLQELVSEDGGHVLKGVSSALIHFPNV
jgi:cell division protease FtsH